MKIERENIGDGPRGDEFVCRALAVFGRVWHNYVEVNMIAGGRWLHDDEISS